MNPDKRARRLNLGERLAVIETIRRGTRSPEQAAEECGVTGAEVLRWMEIHADDRILRVDDVWVPADVKRLTLRAQRLLDLIDTADSDIRALVHLLAQATRPSKNLV
jgi:hypothetical protein